MNDKQKYAAVLEELGEVLQSKNTTISCQKWQIDQLKEKLEKAEAERDEKYDRKVLREINSALRECVDLEAGEIVDVDRLVTLQTCIVAVLKLEGGAA
jgi:hypothetical protein